jgi:hypothetical protein
MKTLIVLSILLVLVPIAIPTLKKINPGRLFTLVMLLIYSIGIIKLVFLFPITCLFLLGAGLLAVLCMAFLPRQKSIRPEVKGADHKIQILHWRQHHMRTKKKGIDFNREWTF